MKQTPRSSSRSVPIEIDPETFRKIGYECIDRIAGLFEGIRTMPITRGHAPSDVRKLIGEGPLPAGGVPAEALIPEITATLLEHSLYNGHPRFWGYITSPAAPVGVLGDLLAAAVNPNVGSFTLSPVGTEIEAQTIRWIAELIGYPPSCGGILTTGGNMANFICFLAARRTVADWDIRKDGMTRESPRLRVYVSSETHTWINKATDISGMGTDAIRWIPVRPDQTMDVDLLERAIVQDRARGDLPFLVVGNAGTVSTGAIDPLPAIAAIAVKHGVWFHVDGAYGALAAVLPDAPADLRGLSAADSVAVDPHKWLYTPLECGCALVRNSESLRETFHYHPVYYRFQGDEDDAPTNYFEYGPQNSRGFRALKVWLSLKQAGRGGFIRMIGDDIALSRLMFELLSAHPEIETFTQGLSITTFRYVPTDLDRGGNDREEYLNTLNADLVEALQDAGEAFVSNAVIGGTMLLRACIVNFRTTEEDVRALPEIVARAGRSLHTRRGG